MVVIVTLVGATEGEKVVALEHGPVVAQEFILPIPEASADALGIHVVGGKDCSSSLSKRLKRGTTHIGAKLGKLSRTAGSIPSPIIAKITKMNVVCRIWSYVYGQTRHEEPRLLWTVGLGSRSTQSVPREESADIHLAIGGPVQRVIAVASIEVELRTKVVIETGHTKIRVIWEAYVGFVAKCVDAVAAGANPNDAATRVIPNRLELVPHLLDQRVNTGAASSREGCSWIASGGTARPAICTRVQVEGGGHWGGTTSRLASSVANIEVYYSVAHISARNRGLVGG